MSFNRVLLKQARAGVKRLIAESSLTIIIYRKTLVDDQMGGEVEDPFGDPIPYEIKCRIDHERKFPGNLDLASMGFSTNLARFVLVDCETTIYINDTLEEIGKGFKIGVVDPIKKFGGVIAYQAPLIEAEKLEEGS